MEWNTAKERDFVEYCNQVFIEHHSAMGMDDEEIMDLIDESTPAQRERLLIKTGYDLKEFYL